MMSDIKRTAIVTGGASGIGKAIAKRLASDGITVASATYPALYAAMANGNTPL